MKAMRMSSVPLAVVSLLVASLGFGLLPEAPSFGRLLSSAKSNLHAPWIGIAAFTALASMLILLIFIGEAIRDALDPRRSFATT